MSVENNLIMSVDNNLHNECGQQCELRVWTTMCLDNNVIYQFVDNVVNDVRYEFVINNVSYKFVDNNVIYKFVDNNVS